MRVPGIVRTSIPWVIVLALVVTAFLTRGYWLAPFPGHVDENAAEEKAVSAEGPEVLKLTPQARKNLQLTSRPAQPQSYWRTIQVPGAIVDRPGHSDRGVTSPAVGVVTQIHAFPGDTVKVGDRLFTLRLFSEYLQSTQKELFSAARETEFIRSELERLRPLADGSVAQARIIDLENQLRRQGALIQAHRQGLLVRGLNPSQIESVAKGEFVSTVEIVAPPQEPLPAGSHAVPSASLRLQAGANAEGARDEGARDEGARDEGVRDEGARDEFAYELQELNAELGQQVQAGQLLSTLANHRSLLIEGHAFKREAPFLATAAQKGWSITVEFTEDDPQHWPALDQRFEIRHLSNAIDTGSRTFDFYIPLRNQSRTYRKGDETFIVWRFRPGQRVRLHVPVEQFHDVLVLPAAAVVREGPEAYVFQQNGDLFNRLPVHVLHEDRRNVVIANDGSVTSGVYLAQNASSSLNRALKAQAAGGVRADVHVHADGTVHASH